MRIAIAAALTVFVVGCAAVDDENNCESVVATLEDCDVDIPADLPDVCEADPVKYDELDGLDCEQLRSAFDQKADGIPGFKSEGDSCVFNLSCAWSLVCRPTEKIYRLPPLSHGGLDGEHQCAEVGNEGDFCDSDGDCSDGLTCRKTPPTLHFACQ